MICKLWTGWAWAGWRTQPGETSSGPVRVRVRLNQICACGSAQRALFHRALICQSPLISRPSPLSSAISLRLPTSTVTCKWFRVRFHGPPPSHPTGSDRSPEWEKSGETPSISFPLQSCRPVVSCTFPAAPSSSLTTSSRSLCSVNGRNFEKSLRFLSPSYILSICKWVRVRFQRAGQCRLPHLRRLPVDRRGGPYLFPVGEIWRNPFDFFPLSCRPLLSPEGNL